MKTLEKLNRRVIELIHGLPYEEALKNELVDGCIAIYKERSSSNDYWRAFGDRWCCKEGKERLCILDHDYLHESEYFEVLGLPITLSRVLQALSNKGFENLINGHINNIGQFVFRINDELIDWKLTNPDFTDCTTEHQTEETNSKLLTLLK